MTTEELIEVTREATGRDCSRELHGKNLVFWMVGGRVFQRDGDAWFEWPAEKQEAA